MNGKTENGESVNSATEIENGENEKSENTESDKTEGKIVYRVDDASIHDRADPQRTETWRVCDPGIYIEISGSLAVFGSE